MENKYDSLEPLTEVPEFCQAIIEIGTPPAQDDAPTDEHQGREPRSWYKGPCGEEIKTMSYKSTGACGEIHRKLQAGESHGEQKALTP